MAGFFYTDEKKSVGLVCSSPETGVNRVVTDCYIVGADSLARSLTAHNKQATNKNLFPTRMAF